MENQANELWNRASDLEDSGKLDEAIKLYEMAASAGSVDAMVNLANILDDKLNPAKPDEAVDLYKRAVQHGSSTAAWNLHRHYFRIGHKDHSDYWLRIAAELGDEDAIRLLGLR